MSHLNDTITVSDIAEGTAKFSVFSILVTGFIYCLALLV